MCVDLTPEGLAGRCAMTQEGFVVMHVFTYTKRLGNDACVHIFRQSIPTSDNLLFSVTQLELPF